MFEGLKRRLARADEQARAHELRARCAHPDATPIGRAGPRGPVQIRGEVAGLQVVPRAGAPSLEVTIDDGTGRAVVVFTGRTRVGGLDPGRALAVAGVARRERGRLVLLNPAYTLLVP